MKTLYPNYFQKQVYADDLIKNLNADDKKILEKYLKHCRLSAGSDKIQQRKKFAVQFRDVAEIPYKKFTRDITEKIYLLIKDSDREISGKNEAIKNLRFFVKWLKEDDNFVKNLKAIRQKYGYNTQKLNHTTLATDEEVEKLIRAGKSLKEKAILTLLAETGIRPCELLELKWNCFKLDDEPATIKVYSPKTKETRVLPLKDSLIHLKRWKDEFEFIERRNDDFVFPSRRRNKLTRQFLNMLFIRLCKNAGIRKLTPYALRHKRLTELNKILPEKISSAYGGHSPQTSARYTHLNTESDIIESVLARVYNVKEPDIKTKYKLEKEIEKIKAELHATLSLFNLALEKGFKSHAYKEAVEKMNEEFERS